MSQFLSGIIGAVLGVAGALAVDFLRRRHETRDRRAARVQEIMRPMRLAALGYVRACVSGNAVLPSLDCLLTACEDADSDLLAEFPQLAWLKDAPDRALLRGIQKEIEKNSDQARDPAKRLTAANDLSAEITFAAFNLADGLSRGRGGTLVRR